MVVVSNLVVGKSKVPYIWNSQKQPPQLLYSCSENSFKIQNRAPVLEALFIKRYRFFPVNFEKLFRTAHLFVEHLWETSVWIYGYLLCDNKCMKCERWIIEIDSHRRMTSLSKLSFFYNKGSVLISFIHLLIVFKGGCLAMKCNLLFNRLFQNYFIYYHFIQGIN